MYLFRHRQIKTSLFRSSNYKLRQNQTSPLSLIRAKVHTSSGKTTPTRNKTALESRQNSRTSSNKNYPIHKLPSNSNKRHHGSKRNKQEYPFSTLNAITPTAHSKQNDQNEQTANPTLLNHNRTQFALFRCKKEKNQQSTE